MFVIKIKVCGDCWNNPAEVKDLLYQTPQHTPICLDFQSEGISINAIGLVYMLDQYCAVTGRNPETITLTSNPNNLEKTRYKNLTSGPSHFFRLAEDYWQPILTPGARAKIFGFFVGRKTIARSWMLYDLYHSHADKFIFSSMHYRSPLPWKISPPGLNLESVTEWIPGQEFQQFADWFDSCPVTSLDGRSVNNQWEGGYNTNLDLVQHYDKFQIELVAETFTIGDTFFPTEKTIRPIMAARPILVYGPKYFLRRLQDLGFETYASCWDENYDELEGPARWQAIRKILPQIEFTDECRRIAVKNRKNLEHFINYNRFCV